MSQALIDAARVNDAAHFTGGVGFDKFDPHRARDREGRARCVIGVESQVSISVIPGLNLPIVDKAYKCRECA